MSSRLLLFLIFYLPVIMAIAGMSIAVYFYVIPAKKIVAYMLLMLIPVVNYLNYFFIVLNIIKTCNEKTMFDVSRYSILPKYTVILFESLLLFFSMYTVPNLAIILLVVTYSFIIINLGYIGNIYSGINKKRNVI